jgi:hypothetical protein
MTDKPLDCTGTARPVGKCNDCSARGPASDPEHDEDLEIEERDDLLAELTWQVQELRDRVKK